MVTVGLMPGRRSTETKPATSSFRSARNLDRGLTLSERREKEVNFTLGEFRTPRRYQRVKPTRRAASPCLAAALIHASGNGPRMNFFRRERVCPGSAKRAPLSLRDARSILMCILCLAEFGPLVGEKIKDKSPHLSAATIMVAIGVPND